MWDQPVCQLLPRPIWCLAVGPLCPSFPSPPQLPISAPTTGLEECFFFNSSVVGLPYSSILWQFWLFFVFILVVVLLLVVQGSKACLLTPPPWPIINVPVSLLYNILCSQPLSTWTPSLSEAVGGVVRGKGEQRVIARLPTHLGSFQPKRGSLPR